MHFRLKWKILLFTVLPLVALTVPPLWVVNRNVSRQVNLNIHEDLYRAGALLEQMLAARGQQLATMGEVIVRDPRFFSILTVPAAERNADFRNTVAGVGRDFNSTTHQDVFEVLDESGATLASAGPDRCGGACPRELVAAALSGSPVTRVVVRSGFPHLLAITPVFVGGRIAGALVLGSHLGQGLALGLRSVTRSQVSLVSRGGASVSTLGADERAAMLAGLPGPTICGRALPRDGRILELRGAHQRYIALIRPLPLSRPSDRQLYVLQRSLDAETEFLRRIQRTLVELGALAGLAALAAGLLISKGITSPLQRLVRAAEELERGNYDYPLDVRLHDEIGYLARRFQDMRQNLRSYVESLREVARVKSEFLSVASHELRTPITIIKGFQELLAAGILGPTTPQQSEAVTAIGKSTETLTRIAENATRMAQIEREQLALERGEVEVCEMLEQVVATSLAAAPQRRVQVRWEGARELGSVSADGARLGQALCNIVQNGIRFTPDGGSVQVRARRERAELVVDVCDTGVGLTPARQREIFERPFALRNSLEHHSSDSLAFQSAGLGLGLSIARGIVQAHGGTLTVDSRPGVGSTFTVRLPADPSLALEAA